MKVLMILFVSLVPLLAACGGPSTYTAYEVIRQADRLETGDDVRVVPMEGDAYRGQVVALEDGRLTVSLKGSQERTIAWSEIRVIERVRQVKAR